MFYSTKFVSFEPFMRVAHWRRGKYWILGKKEFFLNDKLSLLELEADEDAPRHVSMNNDDKNIPLSVAEAQVLFSTI